MTVKTTTYTRPIPYTGTVNGSGTPKEYYHKIQNGGNTPKSLRDEGILNENAYTVEVYHSIDNPVYRKRCNGWYNPLPTASTIMDTASEWGGPVWPNNAPIVADVLPRLYDKWRGSSMNSAVAIAEGRQSLEMVGNTIKSLLHSTRELKRGNLGGALRHLRSLSGSQVKNSKRALNKGDLAGAWLSMRYGWTPMISDIYEASDLVRFKYPRIVVRAGKTNKSVSTNTITGCTVVGNQEQGLYIKILCSREADFYERWGLTDPASVAWELIPFSFVADWFVPIGDTLRAIHAARTLPVEKVITTTLRKKVGSISVNAGYPSCGSCYNCYKVVQGGRWDYTQVNMTRAISTSLPSGFDVTKAVWKRGVFRPELTTKRLIDSVALLVGNLRSFR